MRAVKAEVESVRSESSAASGSAEALQMQCNSLAIKLRAHMAEQAHSEAELAIKLQALEATGTAASAGLLGLQHDSKKVKKHIVRLEKEVEVGGGGGGFGV